MAGVKEVVTPKEAYDRAIARVRRVVAIGAQSRLNRSPRQSVEHLLDWSGEAWTGPIFVASSVLGYFTGPTFSQIPVFFVIFRDVPKIEEFFLMYDAGVGAWLSDLNVAGFYQTHDREKLLKQYDVLSQKDVEEKASLLYTAPYRVERVTDKAVQIARDAVRRRGSR